MKRIVSFQSQLIASKQPSSSEDIDMEITDLHPSQDPHAFSTPAVPINNDSEDNIMLPLTPTDSMLRVHTSCEMCVDGELSSNVFMDSIDPALCPSSPIHDDGLEEMEVDPVTENLDSYGNLKPWHCQCNRMLYLHLQPCLLHHTCFGRCSMAHPQIFLWVTN